MTATLPDAVPFLVGFTGHRNVAVDAQAAVRSAIAGILGDLQAAMPGTPVVLITGLADGADRLAAEAAWERGAGVLAALPMPLADYRADFDAASWAWLEATLPRCQVHALPWLASAAADRSDGSSRQGQYESQGRFITTHSHLLIAAWDGAEGLDPAVPCKRGGTGDVVRRHLTGNLPWDGRKRHLLDLEAQGLVVQVTTPRTGQPAPARAAGHLTWWCGQHLAAHPGGAGKDLEKAAKVRLRLATQRTDRFNQDLALGDPAVPATWRGRGLDALAGRFARIDATANRFQGLVMGRLPKPGDGLAPGRLLARVRGAGLAQGVSFLAIAGAVCQQVHGLGALGSLLLAATYALVIVAWRYDLHGRYLDYRALAEGLRVALWWRLAGIPEPVADNSFHRQRGVADWNRLMLRAMTLDLGPAAAPAPDTLRQEVRRDWLDDQASYFRRAAVRDAWNLGRLRRWAMGLMAASVLLLGAGPLAGWLGVSLGGGLTVAIPACQFAGAIILAYAGVLALGEHAQSYRRMADIYERAIHALDAGTDLAVVCRELGCEALAENAHWLVVHRQHPIEFGRSGIAVKVLTALQRLRLSR